MKILTTLAALILSANLFAQTKINEEFVLFEGEKGNGFTTQVVNAKPDDVIKEFKNYLKQYGGKAKAKGNTLFIELAAIDVISSYPGNVYAIADTDKGNNTLLKVGFKLGGNFITSSDDSGQKAKVLLFDFADKLNKENLKKTFENEADALKKLESTKEDLSKDKEDYNKTIEKAENEISDAKKNLEKNAAELQEVERKIGAQKAAVEAAEKMQKQY